jgi:hypothetical protein
MYVMTTIIQQQNFCLCSTKQRIVPHLNDIECIIYIATGSAEDISGYTELGKELGHTGDLPMAQAIYDGTLEYDTMSDSTIHTIVEQLRKNPDIEKILTPVVTPEDFKSAFKCFLEKTVPSFSGRGIHHCKSCVEGSDDGLAYIQVKVHAVMMTVPLDAALCPERWKQAVDVMLEKVPGISRSYKLRIIQLFESDLNQVLRIAFASNITRLAK